MVSIDRYAVFGQPINHSKSPRIHRLFAEHTGQQISYEAQEVSADQFLATATAFFAQGGKGLNCTVPLKELAYTFADCKTERGQLAKAINTLAIQSDGSILGDNTDGIGLVRDLTINNDISLTGKDILILGAGGACRGILAPILNEKPGSVVIANRNLSKAENLVADFSHTGFISVSNYDDLLHKKFDLIINATSASLSSKLPPLTRNMLKADGCCYDLAYGNKPTPFVLWGFENDARKSLDGLGMLVEQASEAFFIWRGVYPKTTEVIDLLNAEKLLLS
jgi:shikimate dehydrogenase